MRWFRDLLRRSKQTDPRYPLRDLLNQTGKTFSKAEMKVLKQFFPQKSYTMQGFRKATREGGRRVQELMRLQLNKQEVSA